MNVESWFRSPNFVLDNFAVYCKIFEIAGRSCSTVSRIHSPNCYYKETSTECKTVNVTVITFQCLSPSLSILDENVVDILCDVYYNNKR